MLFGIPYVVSGLTAVCAIISSLLIACMIIVIFGGDDFDR